MMKRAVQQGIPSILMKARLHKWSKLMQCTTAAMPTIDLKSVRNVTTDAGTTDGTAKEAAQALMNTAAGQPRTNANIVQTRLQALSDQFEQNFGVKIEPVLHKGRGVIATESFDVGDVVMQELAIGSVVCPEHQQYYCNSCFNELPTPASPSPGVIADNVDYEPLRERYCSDYCFEQGKRDGHEIMWCTADDVAEYCIKRGFRHPLLALQMMCRSLMGDFGLYWDQVELLGTMDTGSWRDIDHQLFKDQYGLLKKALSLRLSGPQEEMEEFYSNVASMEWYTTLRGMMRINAFQIPREIIYSEPPEYLRNHITNTTALRGTSLAQLGVKKSNVEKSFDPNVVPACKLNPGDGIGSAMFLGCSFINHSCDPNLDVRFTLGPTMEVTAIKPIRPGDELSITYTDLKQSVEERKRVLALGYSFACYGCNDCIDFDYTQLFNNGDVPQHIKEYQLKQQ